MELGGAESALLGLLETLDKTEYQVDLFLMRHQGELIQHIPEYIRLLPEIPQYASLAVPLKGVIKRGHWLVAAGRIIGKWMARQCMRKTGIIGDNDIALECSHKYTRFAMPIINTEYYDLAISFLTPHYFVTEKVTAKQKIAWVHTDYSNIQVDKESQLLMWAPYDRIISVSEKVSEGFRNVFPELAEKMLVIQNILPEEYIRERSGRVNTDLDQQNGIRLLSIGRFSYAKNFDNVPDICRRLVDQGLPVMWYLIGYGGDEALIRQRIEEAKMQEHVIVLGKKENPYPFIKACDIYVQPSRYEGKCVAVREAQMLHKPVIITDYATSASQLTDGYDGIVVPMDNEGCARGIAAVIRDSELQRQLSENTMNENYSNREEIQKLYKLIEHDKPQGTDE